MTDSPAVAASSDAARIQRDEGGSQPTLLLHLERPDFSLARWDIRPVTAETARRWLARYHYIGRPAGGGTTWGVFAPDLACIVSLAQPNNDHGVAARLGLEAWHGNVEVARVAAHPECPIERSRMLRQVLVVGARELDWVFSYADPKAGHHGGMYQALGAVYCGVSEVAYGWLRPDGTLLHPRTAVALYGTNSRHAMEQLGYRHAPGAYGGLHTYVLPLRNREAIVAALAQHTQPYPKRGNQ